MRILPRERQGNIVPTAKTTRSLPMALLFKCKFNSRDDVKSYYGLRYLVCTYYVRSTDGPIPSDGNENNATSSLSSRIYIKKFLICDPILARVLVIQCKALDIIMPVKIAVNIEFSFY